MTIIADAHLPFIREYFQSDHELILIEGRKISSQDVKDAEILLVRSITQVNQQLLEHSKVKFVGSMTTGDDHIDWQWLEKAGITCYTAKGFNALPVANYIISVIATLEKNKKLFPKKVKTSLKAAVIGAGTIGCLVITNLQSLGFEVIICDPPRAQQEKLTPSFSYVPFQELNDLDLITIHVPLTKNNQYPTYHFIDKEFLLRQKPDCVLINTSRGEVIHSASLLSHGKHLRWCFDVWENEPHINEDILRRADIATPHIAGYSVESKRRGIEMLYQAARLRGLIKEAAHPLPQLSYVIQQNYRQAHTWQDIVLNVFDPLELTKNMQQIFLSSSISSQQKADFFDRMRREFRQRHEFSFSMIDSGATNLSTEDKQTLKKLGFTFSN